MGTGMELVMYLLHGDFNLGKEPLDLRLHCQLEMKFLSQNSNCSRTQIDRPLISQWVPFWFNTQKVAFIVGKMKKTYLYNTYIYIYTYRKTTGKT